MITKYKIFESKKEKPEIGDWVLCEEDIDMTFNEELVNFINNNIGQFVFKEHGRACNYNIKYENVPTYFGKTHRGKYFDYGQQMFRHTCVRHFKLDEIKYWSKNKEDVEIYLNAKKYNL